MKLSLIISFGLCIGVVGVSVMLVRMDLLSADYLAFLPALIAIIVACVALFIGVQALLSKRKKNRR